MSLRSWQLGLLLALSGSLVSGWEMPLRAQESEVGQPAALELTQTATVQVTAVRLEPTEAGFRVILETAGGELAAPTIQTTGNALIADIPNATLALPEGEPWQQVSPSDEIALISVSDLGDGQVRVAITGVEAPPTAEVQAAAQGLVFSVLPGMADTAAAEEAIQIVVSATRTEAAIADVPRSVTVIEREQIDQQTQVSRGLGDILGQLVPGLAPSTGSSSQFGQSLRGRNTLVLIDGVPQTPSRNVFRNFEIVDPSAIERIEVIQGPTAIYGDGATGGVINIITRTAPAEGTVARTRLGLSTDFADVSGSLGGTVEQYLGGRLDDSDYAFTLSYDHSGGFFDALGDRIPPDPNDQGGLADTDTFNVLGKIGVDFAENQRLQLTVNHYNAVQTTSFTTDPSVADVPGRQRSRAIPGLDLDTPQTNRNTVLSLDYTHSDVLGGDLQGQLYYRDYLTRFVPFDARDFASLGSVIFQSEVDSTEYGGRLQFNTPLANEGALSLLWGADYNNERTSQPINIFDPAAFDASGGLTFRRIGESLWVPPLNQSSLGLFAQLNWEISDRVALLGGVRHERVGLTVDDFTTLAGNAVQGGDLAYDATLFNLGGVVDLSDDISLFANFAQGFSLADVGLVLRNAPAGFSVNTLRPEAQRVNHYELGLRGSWPRLQASLAGFYNTSELGTTFTAPGEILRAPERVYGVEATVDARLSDTWLLGGTASWAAGEIDRGNTGTYTPLDGFRIPPLKLTAYVENQTTPGWSNRLQAIYSGSRDVFADEAVFGQRAVSSYFTMDYISALAVGPGTLEIGIANLLNSDYFPVVSQLQPSEVSNAAGRGRFLRIGYSFEW
ncbi:TonB-dependent receptor [Nodosilinea sp. LEGE 06152]|uniref:TonB-dependent receptor domain-containing protein n=1 Tax=Nodosilinea sp. LEGE 06152 TaxID=2777966 RepID=UPI0024141479|nr:TonB-dependent receptor [Nodosilinea sp. LEGE 06152]